MNHNIIRTEVEFMAVRGRGPGGQNVNKVSSAAILFWNFALSYGVTSEEKYKISHKLKNWINKENQIYIRSDEFRDLERNKSRCFEKLFDLIKFALFEPKIRVPTKPTRAAKTRRKEAKKIRSKTKNLRKKFDY